MRSNVEAVYPLSPMQQGFLFHTVSTPGESTYFEQVACTITGPLQRPAFEQAWNWLIARHSILRTAFAWQDLREPMQVVGRAVKIDIDWQDWRGRADLQAGWQQVLEEDRRRGFDLTRAPLMRLLIRQIADDRHLFLWSHHHILLDGWSFGIVLREVLQCYAAWVQDGVPLAVPAVRPFADFVRHLSGRDQQAQERFWREYLADFATPTRLAVDQGRGTLEGGSRGEITLTAALDPEASRRIQAQCSRLGISLGALVHGAWARLLGAYSGEDEVLFGTTTAGRPPELTGIEQMVGLFINALPMRVQLSPQQRVGDWLTGLQRDLLRVQAHQFTGLARIQDLSVVERGSPLFESLLAFQNYPLGEAHEQQWGGIRLVDYQWSGPTNYPLVARAFPGDRIGLVLGYYPHRIGVDTGHSMLEEFRSLVERLGDTSADAPLGRVEPLAGTSSHRALQLWNDTARTFDTARTMHGLLERQAQARPNEPAVIASDACLTYAQLDGRANQLARYLVELGVRRADRVGLCAQGCASAVVAILAVLKAGAAYVPLDPTYPQERIDFMLEDAQIKVLLTHGVGDRIKYRTSARQISLDEHGSQIATRPDTPLSDIQVTPDMFAYVIYTSGSSGQPKGVMVSHAGPVNNVEDYRQRFALTADDRVLCVSSLSFDISVCNIFTLLHAGGRVVFPELGCGRDPEHWLDLMLREGVTFWHSAPALFDALIDVAAARSLRDSTLRSAVLDGDWIPLSQPDRAHEVFTALQFFSGGGATELSVNSMIYPVAAVDPAWRSIPYGKPTANQTALILDRHMELAPVGVPGELYLGGVAVTAGYFRRPELTARKFLPHPWPQRPGERVYATGDQAKYRADGTIELLGRLDFQVKIRGIRVETGEVESVLRTHPLVSLCLVSAVKDSVGQMRLVAYIVPQTGADSGLLNAAEVQRWMRERVPEHLVPEACVLLPQLPLTPNGKVDRRNLPSPQFGSRASQQVPASDLELRLARHWARILGIDASAIDVQTSFFDLGGNSLKALGGCNFPGSPVPVDALYEHRTLRALAEYLTRGGRERGMLQRLTSSDPTAAVICVPYGGGHVGVYQRLAQALEDRVAVYSVRLPGHSHDGSDAALQSVESVAQAVVDSAEALSKRPLLIYGHCGGVAVATEIARRFESAGVSPRALFVGASYPTPADGTPQPVDAFSSHTDTDLARYFAELGGFSSLTDEQALLIGRLLRHDGNEAQRYFRNALTRLKAPLRSPLICLIGRDDPLTLDYRNGWQTWGMLASNHRLTLVPGGHYFVSENPEAVAETLLQALEDVSAAGVSSRQPALQ
jgi:amino acid adenylation domain-containing protein